MKAGKSLLLIPLASCLMLNSCSIAMSGAELIHPPKITGNEAQIENLIETSAKGKYTLRYPKSGEHRSAIIVEDIDNDQTNEAIAFYHTEAETHILFMYEENDKWEISNDFATSHSDVDCIEFTDYDFDGYKEIFTGFVTDTPGINELTVFDFNGETHQTSHIDFSYQYSKFTTGDYDKDGANEAMLLTLKTSDTDARATLVDYDGENLYALASCSIDSTVTKYENVMSATVDENITGVVIDGLLTNGYNSQIILYDTDTKALINSLSSPVSTERSQTIYSQDIDNDTFVEVPSLSICDTPKGKSESDMAQLVTWYNFNTANYELEFDKCSITNFDYKFNFYLPINFVGTTTALVSEDKKTVSVYHYNKNKLGDLLITFKVFEEDNIEKDYTLLESNSEYSYAYQINQGDLPLYIDDSTIKSNFTLFEISVQ